MGVALSLCRLVVQIAWVACLQDLWILSIKTSCSLACGFGHLALRQPPCLMTGLILIMRQHVRCDTDTVLFEAHRRAMCSSLQKEKSDILQARQ